MYGDYNSFSISSGWKLMWMESSYLVVSYICSTYCSKQN